MAKILVIDDEAGIRDLLGHVLRRKGHEVTAAGEGRTGCALFERVRPDVTILDLRMPEMNGIEVLRRLKATDSGARVIILTGFGTQDEEAQARQLGATAFLHKEFSLHELGDALRRILVG